MRQTPLFTALALPLLSLVWDYNWVVMKSALADCPPLHFTAMRVLGGTLVLFLILCAMGRPLAMAPIPYVLPLVLLQSPGFAGCTLWGSPSPLSETDEDRLRSIGSDCVCRPCQIP